MSQKDVNAHTGRDNKKKNQERHRDTESAKSRFKPKDAEKSTSKRYRETKGQKKREIETEIRRACKRKRNEWAD